MRRIRSPRLELLEGRDTPALLGGLLSPVEAVTAALPTVDVNVNLVVVQTDVSLNAAALTNDTPSAPPVLSVATESNVLPVSVGAQVGSDSLATTTVATPPADTTVTAVPASPSTGGDPGVISTSVASVGVTPSSPMTPSLPPGTPSLPSSQVLVPGGETIPVVGSQPTTTPANPTATPPATLTAPPTIDATQLPPQGTITAPQSANNAATISVPANEPAAAVVAGDEVAAATPNTVTPAAAEVALPAPAGADLGLVGEEAIDLPAGETDLPDALASGLATDAAPFGVALIEQALRQYLDGLGDVREAVQGWTAAVGPWSWVCVGVTVAAAGELARRRMRQSRARLAGAAPGGEDVDSWFTTNLTPGA